MWTRAYLKERAKVALKQNYLTCVLVGFIFVVCAALTSGGPSPDSYNYESYEAFLESVSASLPIGKAALALIIELFVLNPLTVGVYRFFIVNSRTHEARIGEILYGFRNNYFNICLVMFVQQVYLLLWTLLFIIPGIIKTYSYFLVPYILAEDSGLGANEAITMSR